jgi:hypothetical protein
MITEWSLRDEIQFQTHRWPVIVIFCLAGSLLGWGVSLTWPSPHRATKELYVGLNIYQAARDRTAAEHAGLEFLNIDDYKNWQMASLNSLIFTDGVIDETLHQLQAIDGYWSSFDQRKLAKDLHAYWRNAGKWRLVAESDDPHRAAEAVTVWQDVVVREANIAIGHSKDAMALDRQLQVVLITKSQAQARLAELTELHSLLQGWHEDISALTDQTIDANQFWTMHTYLTNAAADEFWSLLLEEFPDRDAPQQDYIVWLDRAARYLDTEIQIQQFQIDTLEENIQRLTAQYEDASQKSQGLSADLLVDKITDEEPVQSIVRPTGQLMLIGSILGLIVWGYLFMARISMRI